MATIDELGRRAGRNLLEEAARLVDVDEGFEEIRSAAGAVPLSAGRSVSERSGRRPGRLWTAAAAATVIAVVTGVVFVVTRRSGLERLVTELPPGSTVGETSETAVRFVPSLGDVVTIDIEDPTHVRAAVSPSGEWVAYRGPEGSVCLASPSGNAVGWCEDIPEFGSRLSWSPDSTRFTGSEELQSGRLTRPTVVDLDGSWTTLDLDLDRPLTQTSFALDGESIVGVTPGTSETGPVRLVVVDADTGATRVVTDAPRVGAFSDPFPIDPRRSVFYAPATANGPDVEPAIYVLDHTDGTLEPIYVPDGDTLTRIPIGVTSTQPPVVLMSKARPIRDTPDGGAAVAFHDFELWDIDTGEVTPLPSSPSSITPFGSAISPDGKHLAMAWTTTDGDLQLGVARIDDLVAADGTWPGDAWSVETLADVDLSSGYYTSLFEPRRVCWCQEHVFVIARDNVYTLDLEAIPDTTSSQTTPLPD